MSEKTNKEKKKRASPKNKGRGKKQKLLHLSDTDSDTEHPPSRRNDQNELGEDSSSHEHTEQPGDFFPTINPTSKTESKMLWITKRIYRHLHTISLHRRKFRSD